MSTASAPAPESVHPWAPNMTYKARRPAAAIPTLCERYVEQQVVTFFRGYIPLSPPSFDYDPTMERATKFVVITVNDLYAEDIK